MTPIILSQLERYIQELNKQYTQELKSDPHKSNNKDSIVFLYIYNHTTGINTQDTFV